MIVSLTWLSEIHCQLKCEYDESFESASSIPDGIYSAVFKLVIFTREHINSSSSLEKVHTLPLANNPWLHSTIGQ